MKQIMIATGNMHKVAEFKRMLAPLDYEVKSLADLQETITIEENGTSFQENALIKARAIHDCLGIAVVSDDSGLVVNAMNGAPGIYSARFMGEDTSYTVKNQAIIDAVNQHTDRGAKFVCAIAYIEENGNEHVFTGVVEGEIAKESIGEKGFGYDPIFFYPPYQTTLANVSEDMKNKVSHRGRALAQLVTYMEEHKK